MAKEVIGAQVDVDYKSVGDLRKAVKEATGEVIKMQQQFGATSKEALEAAKRVAQLKDRVKEAAEVSDLFDPGNKFKALGNTVQLAASGFTALQGAIGLFGVKSEEVEKQLLKVQSALALSQGLSALADGAKEFTRLKAVAIDAFKGIKAAIGSTGIGLIVVAIGSLVAYWEDIKELVTGVSGEQKKLNEQSKKNLETEEAKLKTIGDQDNVLKLQGKTEKQILQIKKAQTDEVISAAEIALANQEATVKAQVETAKRNQDILQGIIEFVTTPFRLVLQSIEFIGRAFGKNLNLLDAYKQSTKQVAGLIFDPEQTLADGEKTIQEARGVLDRLKNERAGYQLQINDIDKKAAETRKNQAKVDEEINLSEIIKRTQTEIETRAKLVDEDFKNQLSKNANFQTTLTANEQEQVWARVRLAEIEKTQKLLFLEQLGAGLGAFSNLVGKQTIAGKVLGVAEATINTFVAASKSLKADYSVFGPFALAAKIAAFSSTIATGLGAVRSIAKVQVPGGGGGSIPNISTSAPLTPALSPQAQGQALNANAINNLNNRAIKAYILNSDLQNSQQINDYLTRNSTI